MKRLTIEKTVVSLILIAWYLLMPTIGYKQTDTTDVVCHICYMWSHANIWHLAGNLFVLWLIRGRMYLVPSIVIALVCSWIPAFSMWGEVGMTIGFSGVLFAVIGIKWGVYCRNASMMGRIFEQQALLDFAKKCLPFALVGFIIPHINWCIHLYSLIAGLVYGRVRG